MAILLVFAFVAGIITILSPCILPILPIVLSSSVGGGHKRPLGVVMGFVLSFTFFTLFLSIIVKATGVAADNLRLISVFVIAIFGLTLLIPRAQLIIEQLFAKLSRFTPRSTNQTGFLGGLLVGVSLGLLWTPCVGPILASVISLAITGSVSGTSVLITLSYAIGTALPMLAIIFAGQRILQKVPWLLANASKIQRVFGVVMILTAIGIYFNVDRKFQSYILDKFPEYGVGLTKIEDNPLVKQQLEEVNKQQMPDEDMGRPLNELINENIYPPASEIIPGGQWFNSQALTLEGLRGKVVLIDFWTYTCINCQRTFPYLRQWHEKYKDAGLVIIGVHSPEFEFEKDPDNLAKAIADFNLAYPIVQDNDFATWRAYSNRYWPAKYFIDKNGRIRGFHAGEGAYDESEHLIQKLLAETGSDVSNINIQNESYQLFSKTPELYLGYLRMQYFDSDPKPVASVPTRYALKSITPARNRFGFVGEWRIEEEYASPSKGASLQLNFDAKDVYLVMRPKTKATVSRVLVKLDGQIAELGSDVEDGVVRVDADRLYKLVELAAQGNHVLTLEFLDGEIEIFAFTFG